jgi:hypothetical protein
VLRNRFSFGGWRNLRCHPGGLMSLWSIRGKLVKLALNIVGVLLVIVGVVWFLQGINVLPGSFMTGQTKWAINGGIAFVVGLALLVTSRKLGRR